MGNIFHKKMEKSATKRLSDSKISPFLRRSSHLSRDIHELGLRRSDAYRYSPSKTVADCDEDDGEWFLKFRAGVNLFNLFPEKGIQYFIQQGYIGDSATVVAEFLLECVGLSKYRIGNYVSKMDDTFRKEVLRQMTSQMNMADMNIDDALRFYQKHFHLAGGKCQVQHVLEYFSERYVECNPWCRDAFKKPTSAVLGIACALVVLNMDIRNKREDEDVMTKDEFREIVCCADDGKDIEDVTLVDDMYDRVVSDPFTFGWDYVAEIYDVPIYTRKKEQVVLSDTHRRLVYDCIMYLMSRRWLCPVFERFLSRRRVNVLVFNDIFVVLKGGVNGSYVLVAQVYITDVVMDSTHARRYRTVTVRKKDTGNFCLKLLTFNEKKMDNFLWVISEISAEIEETEKALSRYNLSSVRASTEVDEEIHF